MTWNKYHAKKVHHAGYSFASKLEAAVYNILHCRVLAGELSELKCQPHVFLTQARIESIPDFSAIDLRLDALVYFEAKGLETAVWRVKRKLWTHYGPGRLVVYKGTHLRPYIHEEIIPKAEPDVRK